MKILHTVKYYEPSRGGMESVVKNIVEGVSKIDPDISFTVYANNHFPSLKKTIYRVPQIEIIKEVTPFIFKSQPLSFRYQSLRKLIQCNDIIHHHYPFPNMEMSLFRNRDLLKGKKLVITWHANIKNSRWSFIKKHYNPLIEKMLDMTDQIIVTSPQLFESSDILGKHEQKVIVIPLGFDPAFDVNESTARTLDCDLPKKILFVGKLRSYKGITYLIDAIQLLDVKLIIVGDGEEELRLKKQVDRLGLNLRVQFLKNIGDIELRNIYKDVDLFVLPSINEAEAFGVVQLEAMANGLPVINTKLNSGVPFVSLDQVSGLTVAPKNVIQLSNAISKILGDKELYETFSKNSLNRSLLFSRKKLAESYLALYNK